MNPDLQLLYAWTMASRERVFRWLETLPDGVYTQERGDFAYGSLRNIQAHIAECYGVWIGARGLHISDIVPCLQAADIPDVAAMRVAFGEVDRIVEQALSEFTAPDESLTLHLEHENLAVTQRWLILHPITHEFHHKGQMLALGRVLGHPVGLDTDLPTPFEHTPFEQV